MIRFALLIFSVMTLLGTVPAAAQTSKNIVSGSVFIDQNKNQRFDNEQILRGWFVKITDHATHQTQFVATDAQGNYSAEVGTGEHTVEIIAPNSLWLPSQRSTILNFPTLGNTQTRDFAVSAVVNCAAMQVQVTAADASRRCQEVTVSVKFSNNGTQKASNAFVDVLLPNQTNFKGAPVQFSLLEGGRLVRLYLGDVPVNEFGEIGMQTETNCDAPEGATALCYEAAVYPNSPCTTALAVSNSSTIASRTWSKFGGNIIIEDEIIFRRPNMDLGGTHTPIATTNSQNSTTSDFVHTSIGFFGNKPMVLSNPAYSKDCKTVIFAPKTTGSGGGVLSASGISKDKKYAFTHFTPNPVIDLSTILLPENLPQNAVFELYDIAGRLQKRENLSGRQFTLNRQNLPAGLYVYRMISGKEVLNTGKIVVK